MKLCLACEHRFTGSEWSCPRCGRSPARRRGYPVFAPERDDHTDDYDASLFDRLAALEPGNYWFEARNRLIVWALRRFFPEARSFLEIGCGTGFVLRAIHRALPALTLAGTDVHSRGLAYAGARVPGARLFQMDARRIPFEDEFDVVGAFDVLEHIDNDELVLAESGRALRHGGGLLITVPQHPFLWSPVDRHARHQRRYTRADLTAKIRRAGLAPAYATSFVSLLLPAMLASRIARRGEGRAADPLPELHVGRATNMTLAAILRLERLLIAAGLSFPVGGSLLVVARRPE